MYLQLLLLAIRRLVVIRDSQKSWDKYQQHILVVLPEYFPKFYFISDSLLGKVFFTSLGFLRPDV